MRGLLRWIGNAASVAFGGSGIVDPGDPTAALPLADDAAPRWVARLAVLAPIVVIVLALVGLPWPILAIVAVLLLLPLIVNRVQVLRRG